MPKLSAKYRQMIQLMANREIAKKIKKAMDTLQSLDVEDFNNALEFINTIKKENKLEASIKSMEKLIKIIQSLDNNEKEDVIKLLDSIRYPQEKNEDKIISPYLQQQLVKVIYTSLYWPQESYSVLKEEHNHLRLQNRKLIKKNE
ncbi:19338_t:CDS:1, partial [Dentiscutata erythropus]